MKEAFAARLDEPDSGLVANAQIHIKGWAAVTTPGGFTVDAWIDGERLGPVAAQVDRPDVSELRDDGTPVRCGFEGGLPIGGRRQGPAQLRVRISDALGREVVLERTLELQGDPFVPRRPPAGDEPKGYRILREGQLDRGAEWPWFGEHYEEAPNQIIDFLEGDGLSLEGLDVADIGCGDGIIDLGLAHRTRPRRLVGYDLEEVDVARLGAEAAAHGVGAPVPPELEFAVCGETLIPAPDHSFDAVVSWSTFEHVREPVLLLRDIRRVLRADGFLFLQIWPLWWSEHGSHLWPWFPRGFAQFRHTDDEIERVLGEHPRGNPEDMRFIRAEARNLNRISVDDLQRALQAAGFHITKFEFLTTTTRLTRDLARYPLTDLGIGGIKLIAVGG